MSKKRSTNIIITKENCEDITKDIIWMSENLKECKTLEEIRHKCHLCFKQFNKLYHVKPKHKRENYEDFEVTCCAKGKGSQEYGAICNVLIVVKVTEKETSVNVKGINHGSEMNETIELKKIKNWFYEECNQNGS